MAISTDYASPVQVNGYSCRNCTDVDYAKKGIDPAHPKSGPYGVNAATDPDRRTEAVSLGGKLAEFGFERQRLFSRAADPIDGHAA